MTAYIHATVSLFPGDEHLVGSLLDVKSVWTWYRKERERAKKRERALPLPAIEPRLFTQRATIWTEPVNLQCISVCVLSNIV